MQHTDPSPSETDEPGGTERTPDERPAARVAPHVEDHHFEHPPSRWFSGRHPA